MAKAKPVIRVASKVFPLEVMGVDDFGAETLFKTEVVIHTSLSHNTYKSYIFIQINGEWQRLVGDNLRQIMRTTDLWDKLKAFVDQVKFCNPQKFVGVGLQNIMRGPYETGIRYTGD